MKDKILEILKKNKDGFTSGEELSKALGITRAAIWKHMKALKEDGYIIKSIPNKGYNIEQYPDLLTYGEISPFLKSKTLGRSIHYFSTLDSTNTKAKEFARKGDPEGTLIISESQTSGRGRLGRSWVSPHGKGIWMSMILRPDFDPTSASKITLIAAAALHKALEKTYNINCKIKWPNDIIMNNKKLCGILTEMSAELNQIHYIIIGMGINVNLDYQDFSEDLRETATSLKIEEKKSFDRKVILAEVLNQFEVLYEELVKEGHMNSTIDICKAHSVFLGKEVKCINRDVSFIAKAIDINDQGELIVKKEDGSIEKIISGEVSIRGLYGYV